MTVQWQHHDIILIAGEKERVVFYEKKSAHLNINDNHENNCQWTPQKKRIIFINNLIIK